MGSSRGRGDVEYCLVHLSPSTPGGCHTLRLGPVDRLEHDFVEFGKIQKQNLLVSIPHTLLSRKVTSLATFPALPIPPLILFLQKQPQVDIRSKRIDGTGYFKAFKTMELL